MLALGLGEGDAVITTPNSFVATANCARYVGATIIFADIDPKTGLIDPTSIARLLSKDLDRTIKAIIPVHFAGQPADLPAIYALARRHGPGSLTTPAMPSAQPMNTTASHTGWVAIRTAI